MNDISTEAKKILEAIKLYGPIRSTELIKMFRFSSKTIHKHLLRLFDEQLIKKIGVTPKVFYIVNTDVDHDFGYVGKDEQIIEQNYIYVSPNGEMFRGIHGFWLWCEKNKFDFLKEKKTFIQKFKLIQKLKKNGLISAKKIILSGKNNLYLDNIFFSDFYNIAHFGKTKLGQLVYLGKSSQNKILVMEIARLVKPAIRNILEKYEIKLICFIPPTIDRQIQFLDVFKKSLKLNLAEIIASKIPSFTKVAQKTLRNLEDRIINAQKTIAVNPNQKIDGNILIIDDATGSGATLNETAKKIRNISKENIKIIGYSVIGSFKGFDVISEV